MILTHHQRKLTWHHKNVKICENLQKQRFKLNAIKSWRSWPISANTVHLFECNSRVYCFSESLAKGWGKQAMPSMDHLNHFPTHPDRFFVCISDLILTLYLRSRALFQIDVGLYQSNAGRIAYRIFVGIIRFFCYEIYGFFINKILKTQWFQRLSSDVS